MLAEELPDDLVHAARQALADNRRAWAERNAR
jgi:hypothetical protein